MKAVSLLLFAMSLGAEYQAPESTGKMPAKGESQDPVIDYYDAIADYFRNSPRAVAEINKKGVPSEEIPAVLLIARKSSASPNQVIAARTSGKSWTDIATQHKVTFAGTDFVKEANVQFLSNYHGVPMETVRSMNSKGVTFQNINQELRRGGTPAMPRKTERAK